MKNEDKIVEILAEALQKLDQHSAIFEKQGGLLEKLVDGQNLLTDQMVGLRQDFNKMNGHLL